MKIKKVTISNFRCLKDVSLNLDDTTVILGQNNTGKSAFLDAIKLAIRRRSFGRNILFDEYDFYMAGISDEPQKSPGIKIELFCEEEKPDEWPDPIIQELDGITQTDAIKDIDSIYYQVICKYDDAVKDYPVETRFLAFDGTELKPKGLFTKQNAFFEYIPVFYLSALRDAAREFTSKSQFWGRLLKSIDIPEEKKKEIQESIESLNNDLLHADAKLDKVINTLDKIKKVFILGEKSSMNIRALPMKIWDLMSKSEIVLQSEGGDAKFPLNKHGQGVQSISILFLFQAFVEILLKAQYRNESEPILTLEEPEAHLHPHAARAVWRSIEQLPGQKIVTTHSPYFIQHVPFRKLRILRREGTETRVCWLPKEVSVKIPLNSNLNKFCEKYKNKFSYDENKGLLFVKYIIEEKEFRELLICFKGNGDEKKIHKSIRKLKEYSICLLSDQELESMETFARRMRGEIFFARAWLLCEGVSDYKIIHKFAEILELPLDTIGVSIIDYQNNGSPGAFTSLARAFEFPWVMLCDNDEGGNNHIEEVKKRGWAEGKIKDRIHQLPEVDLEYFLFKNGFKKELTEIAKYLNKSISKGSGADSEEDILRVLRNNKVEAAGMLANKLTDEKAGKEKVPNFFKLLIEKVEKVANE